MVGLVFADSLRLMPLQWGAVVGYAAGWLWWYLFGEARDDVENLRKFLLTTSLLLCELWCVFWNQPDSLDSWLLFREAREMASLSWQEALEELPLHAYVRYQTPFLSFWFSRLPAMWLHQLIWFPFGLLCAGVMRALYGRAAALLLATPVFALMIHQPSHDTLLFGLLLIVLRLIQMQQRALAAFVYGLSWMVKPLTILTVPFILPQLGWFGLGSLVMWGGYVGWSLQWTFGQLQFRFLLQQVMIRHMKRSSGSGAQALPISFPEQARRVLRKLRGTLRWRWEHIGEKAVRALPFYLFPAWLRPWSWKGIVLCGVILLGYGNIKYLLLDLLFLFPVQEERDGLDSLLQNEF